MELLNLLQKSAKTETFVVILISGLFKMSFNKKNKFLVFLLLFFLYPLYAREITITVQDRDLELPLEGAVVRSWDGSSHFCDENGRVSITVPEGRRVSYR